MAPHTCCDVLLCLYGVFTVSLGCIGKWKNGINEPSKELTNRFPFFLGDFLGIRFKVAGIVAGDLLVDFHQSSLGITAGKSISRFCVRSRDSVFFFKLPFPKLSFRKRTNSGEFALFGRSRKHVAHIYFRLRLFA